jgi:glycosyltransferase involved in cell wall biosynthesis
VLVKHRRPRLAFVSPQFLFPNDTGGKIRTTNILRGLHGGAFEVTLLSPATAAQAQEWETEIDGVCDHFVAWPAAPRAKWLRVLDLLRELPVNVAADDSVVARGCVRRTLKEAKFDVVVFDFVHAAVLMPDRVDAATVCFTHNVEAEIFQRHVSHARSAAMRALWASQYRKMERFEGQTLRRFTRVVAVSERDAEAFQRLHGIGNTSVIPTGVDLGYFGWQAPPAVAPQTPPTVVFTGSMDWAANQDGMQFFIEQVWPRVLQQVPAARFVAVGRNVPASLLALGQAARNVSFTGWVDDVRPHVRQAHAFVIPLRVGGGTRIKAYEALAMGCPVVSTSIGIEGLDMDDGEHFLRRDDAESMAQALVQLLGNAALRQQLSQQARALVESRFGHAQVARVFERHCLRAMEEARAPAALRAAQQPVA